MEIIYVIVGILSAIFTIMVVYSVMGVFKFDKQIENVLGHMDTIQRKLDSMENDIHRRIDTESTALVSDIREVQSNLNETEKDIVSLLDRRLDKLENKLKGMIPPTNDELMKRIENIEEQSYRLRMNM